MTIHQIAFSPTGGTRRVSELLCSGIEAKSILTELCVKEEELCLPSIAAGDLVVVSMPVYAGRVLALAVERLNAVESNGATCVIVAVYGNRAYEDALVEMQDVATAQGFNVVAAVAANAEHSICRMYGADNPKDNNQLCIGCMRCVSVCPSHARGIGESLKVLAARLEPLCRDRKKNELFLC